MLGSRIEYIPVFFTYGKAAYIVRSSPATPIGYKMIKKLYLGKEKPQRIIIFLEKNTGFYITVVWLLLSLSLKILYTLIVISKGEFFHFNYLLIITNGSFLFKWKDLKKTKRHLTLQH